MVIYGMGGLSLISPTPSRIWVLRLGSTLLGVDPAAFKGVLEVSQTAPVPLAPQPLLGLLSNQGQILPVFDLSQVLQIPEAGSGAAALLEFEGQALAFMIDEVIGLQSNLSGARITPSQHPLFRAVLEEGGQTVPILEVGSLFAHLAAQMSTGVLNRPGLQA